MTTALYRRYRPETFDEVIGQDHVTEPLKAALRSNRVTHAYLFSGPRGCGKTTSARILARCLNCVEGPTDTPCGVCESCRELATGGPGSLDVVEIDAASHNGVDDARELRERATFAPVRDRYKVFILDEAHMVTPQGFNALLKLVEEPPEHVKFVFATTEPERVIGTIRSRTHHYPFRLVPADVMTPFLAQMCEQESVSVGEGVLPLVVRAGGGSVRDSLSVLDQLMAGSIDSEISYDRAVALLGYTDASLLDNAVEALGDRDGAAIFAAIESMVESGHDPRRFVEDFLERLRDLLIIAVAGEDARDILSELPSDQRERMFEQAKQWGAPALSTAADLTDEALRTMVGATSPRLQLELLVGRILVALASPAPGQQSPRGGVAGISGAAGGVGGATGGAAAPAAPAVPGSDGPQIMGPDGKPLTGAALAREQLRRSRSKHEVETNAKESLADAESVAGTQPGKSADAQQPQVDERPQAGEKTRVAEKSQAAEKGQATEKIEQGSEQDSPKRAEASKPADGQRASEPQSPEPQSSGNVTANLHGKWDEFVEAVRTIMPSSHFLIAEHATLVSEDATTVTLGFTNQNFVNLFMGRHVGPVAQAIEVVTGVKKTPVAVVGTGNQQAPQTGNQPGHQPGPQQYQQADQASRQAPQSRDRRPHDQQTRDSGPQSRQQQPQPNEQRSQQPQSSTAWPTVRQVPDSRGSADEESEGSPDAEPSRTNFQTFEGGARQHPDSNSAEHDAGTVEHDAGNAEHSAKRGNMHGNSIGEGSPGSRGQAREASSFGEGSDQSGASPADQGNVSGAPANAGDFDADPNSYQRIPHPSGQGRGPRLRTYDGGQKPNQQPTDQNDQPQGQQQGRPNQPGQSNQPAQNQRSGGMQPTQPNGPQQPTGPQQPDQQEPNHQPPGQDQPTPPASDFNDPTGGARIDDVGAENMNLVGLPLVEKMFGAKVIEDNEGNS